MHCLQHLSEVGAHTILMSFICRREQRDNIKLEYARSRRDDVEYSFCVIAGSCDGSSIFLPCGSQLHRYVHFSQFGFELVIGTKKSLESTLELLITLCPERESVLHSLHHIDAPESGVSGTSEILCVCILNDNT